MTGVPLFNFLPMIFAIMAALAIYTFETSTLKTARDKGTFRFTLGFILVYTVFYFTYLNQAPLLTKIETIGGTLEIAKGMNKLDTLTGRDIQMPK